MSRALVVMSICIYNGVLLGGTAYLVNNGWSAWWFLIPIIFGFSLNGKTE